MEQIRPFVIKYIYIAAVIAIFLTYLMVPSVALGNSLLIALLVSLVLYFVGDRFLITRFGTLTTVIANFVMAALVLSLANMLVREPINSAAIFASAAVIGVAEWFYYRYVRGEVAAVGQASGITGDQPGAEPPPQDQEQHGQQEHQEGHQEHHEGDHQEG